MKTTLLLLAALSTTTLSLVGCAADSDNGSTASSNLDESPQYDAVLSAPDQTITTMDNAVTPTQSFAANTKTYFPNKTIQEVGDQLVKFNDWTQIVQADGVKPFVGAHLASDATVGDVRTLTGTFQLQNPLGGAPIPLEMKATIKTNDDGDHVVSATNTAPVSAGAIPIANTGAIHIDVLIGAYADGTMVDAKMTAKASNPALESQAAQRLGPLLPAIVKWSKAALH